MVSGERGFTLIELTVAVTIFTVGVLGMLKVTAGITRMLGMSRRVATASFFAQERLETLRATSCAALASGMETRAGIYDVQWGVEQILGGNARRVQILITFPSRPDAIRVDTLGTSMSCVL